MKAVTRILRWLLGPGGLGTILVVLGLSTSARGAEYESAIGVGIEAHRDTGFEQDQVHPSLELLGEVRWSKLSLQGELEWLQADKPHIPGEEWSQVARIRLCYGERIYACLGTYHSSLYGESWEKVGWAPLAVVGKEWGDVYRQRAEAWWSDESRDAEPVIEAGGVRYELRQKDLRWLPGWRAQVTRIDSPAIPEPAWVFRVVVLAWGR